MVYEFTVFTVIHTGTNFIQTFFNELGFEWKFYRLHSPPTVVLDGVIRDKLNSGPVVVTARDPYLSAFHYLSLYNNAEKGIKELDLQWNMFLNILPTINYYVVDVDCTQENRHSQLSGAIQHIGYNPADFEPKIKDYASNWKPLNSTKNKMKLEYFETGKLPKGHDWSVLDEAVDWYKNLPTNSYE